MNSDKITNDRLLKLEKDAKVSRKLSLIYILVVISCLLFLKAPINITPIIISTMVIIHHELRRRRSLREIKEIDSLGK
jgi:hypothetical protein